MKDYGFEHYLKAGHGRAYLMARKDPEKYRDAILKACTADYSFDLQCEGSRAYLTADLVDLFSDKTPFIKAAEERFLSSEVDTNAHDIQHLSDFLAEMGMQDLIASKYKYLWQELYRAEAEEADAPEEPDDSVVITRPDSALILESIEYLAMRLLQGGSDVEDVISEMSAWCKKEEITGKEEFPWFFSELEEEIGKEQLIKMAGSSDSIRTFIEGAFDNEDDRLKAPAPSSKKAPTAKEIVEQLKADKELFGINLIRLGIRKMSEEEKLLLAKEAIDTTSLQLRTQIVSAFYSSWFTWPAEASYLVEWTKLGDEALSCVCRDAMSEIKAKEIREYALESLKNGFDKDCACMLIQNFEQGDEEVLLPMLYDLEIDDEDQNGWHAIGHVILDNDLPDSMLYWVYKSTLCSFCREAAVEKLLKREGIPEGFRVECSWDARLDIRKMVE